MKRIQLIKLLHPIVISVSCFSLAEASESNEKQHYEVLCKNQIPKIKETKLTEEQPFVFNDIKVLSIKLAANVKIEYSYSMISYPQVTFNKGKVESHVPVAIGSKNLVKYLDATTCFTQDGTLNITNEVYQPYQYPDHKDIVLVREHGGTLNDEIPLPTLTIQLPHQNNFSLKLFANAGTWEVPEANNPIYAELSTSPKCNKTVIKIKSLQHKAGISKVKAVGLSEFTVENAGVYSIAYGNNFEKLVAPNQEDKQEDSILKLKNLTITENSFSHN